MTKTIYKYSESIEHHIFFIRGMRVILDSDLSSIYGVKTKALNQAVKRKREISGWFCISVETRRPCSYRQSARHPVTNCDRFKTQHSIPSVCVYRTRRTDGFKRIEKFTCSFHEHLCRSGIYPFARNTSTQQGFGAEIIWIRTKGTIARYGTSSYCPCNPTIDGTTGKAKTRDRFPCERVCGKIECEKKKIMRYKRDYV